MNEPATRVAWFAIFLGAFAYVCYLFLGSIFQAEYDSNISIQDNIEPGKHFISGFVTVPSPCHQISVGTSLVGTTTYAINLQTWREPSVKDCGEVETPRQFETLLRAPSIGIDFVVFLNGVAQQFDFLPILPEVK